MPSGSEDVAEERNQSWIPSTEAPFQSQLSGGISRGQWEQFMAWDNSQTKGSFHPGLSTSGINAHIQAFVPPEVPSSFFYHSWSTVLSSAHNFASKLHTTAYYF
jgi:hypothetical protein